MRTSVIHGLVLSLLLVIFSGCTTKRISMTYYSDPPGAVIYEGQRLFGYAPITVYYQVSPESRQRGYVQIRETTARWVSGASVSNGGQAVLLNQRTAFRYNFLRPDNIQGREKDVNFALQLQHNQILQQTIQEQKQKKIFGNVGEGVREIPVQLPQPQL